MRNLPRLAGAAAATVLLGLSLSACGGSAADAPTDASKDDFCEAFSNDDTSFDDMKDVGTPAEITGEAREGFEIAVDKGEDIADDASMSEAQDAFGDDWPKVEAFLTEAVTLCTPDVSEMMPTELPT